MPLLLRHNGLGQLTELDVTALGGRGIATLNFGAGKGLTSVSVSAPSITAQSVVTAQVAAIATAEHSADEHVIEALDVRAGAPVPGVGFTVYGSTRNVRLFGRFNVAWIWG